MFAQVCSAFLACKNNGNNDALIWDRNKVAAPPASISMLVKSFFRHRVKVKVMAQEQEEQEEQAGEEEQKVKFPPRVVVGGGSGFIGTELVRHLRRRGYDVVIISRANYGKEEGEWMTWSDLEEDGLPPGTRAVVNLAGRNFLDPFKRWTPEFQKEVYDSRVNTARSLSAAIEKASPHKRPDVFVQISGVGFYPRDDQLMEGKVYDETYDPSYGEGGKVAQTDYFINLTRDWEKAAMLTKDVEMDTRQVIIRSGVVLGRTGGLIQRIFPPFYLGLGGPLGTGNQPLPWIHVKDLVGIITLAIEKEFVCGVLNATAPELVTNKQFVETFAGSMWRPAVVPVPEVVWNFIFGEERAKIITHGQRVDCKRTLEVGYKFRFGTISQACREFSNLFYVDQDTSLGE